ncbi:hypothetical protein PFISCL1PPCAC_20958, partial [Pristionchus fissidentatus]
DSEGDVESVETVEDEEEAEDSQEEEATIDDDDEESSVDEGIDVLSIHSELILENRQTCDEPHHMFCAKMGRKKVERRLSL